MYCTYTSANCTGHGICHYIVFPKDISLWNGYETSKEHIFIHSIIFNLIKAFADLPPVVDTANYEVMKIFYWACHWCPESLN